MTSRSEEQERRHSYKFLIFEDYKLFEAVSQRTRRAANVRLPTVKMDKAYVIFMTLFSLFHCMVQELTPDPDCGSNPGTSRTVKLALNSKRNQTGEWVDIFTARTESSNSSDSMNLDVTHRVTECEGKRVIYIQGVSNGIPIDIYDGKLRFHPRCGKNSAFLNKGRTVQKINVDDAHNSVAFTNRPLKNNEIFEVILDKKLTKYSHALAIGVMKKSPEVVEILPQMWQSLDAWMYYNDKFYADGKENLSKYGRDINKLNVGDRLGVMRNELGTLHFFVNGIDQGPAAANIPSPVYGVFELWNNAAKATIVDATYPPSS